MTLQLLKACLKSRAPPTTTPTLTHTQAHLDGDRVKEVVRSGRQTNAVATAGIWPTPTADTRGAAAQH
jgi:hypothetical protein